MAEVRSRVRPTDNPKFTSLPFPRSSPSSSSPLAASSHIKDHRSPSRDIVPQRYWVLAIAFNAALFYYLHHINHTFPEPLGVDSPLVEGGRFSEGRARRSLEGLVALGSRPVGSDANERGAVKFLTNEVEGIRREARTDLHTIELDIQHVSGSFAMDFLGGFTSVYQNVNNVVVRLSPAANQQRDKSSRAAVLVSCHYDTVMNSTGASDDGVSCAIMLDTLRVLASRATTLAHDVVFLFNGAEENILQASHGFITQHRWAKDIRAFINLDSAGAGGRELLFQAGPEHPWLVRAYAEHAPHPFASIIGQEVFDSGIVPSDTDYRIYRDFGNLPGLDVAYITNGYVYHTPADAPRMIPRGCVQRAGENVVGVLAAIADSPYLVEPGEYRHGKLVYFDVVGWGVIVYTMRVGVVLNLGCLLAVVIRYVRAFRSKGAGYFRDVAIAVVVIVLSWVLSVASAIVVALMFDWLGRAMTWYTNVWLAAGLFGAPAFLSAVAWVSFAKRRFHRGGNTKGGNTKSGSTKDGSTKSGNTGDGYDPWRINDAYFDATIFIFSVALGGFTAAGLGSAVMALSWVAFPLATRALYEVGSFQPPVQSSPGAEPRRARWLIVSHYAGLVAPNLLFLYIIYDTLVLFVPIMGRAGAGIPPDVVVAVIVSAGFAVCFTPHAGFVGRDSRRTFAVAATVFVAAGLLAAFTPVGFPYQADAAAPTRQRHIVQHLERNVRDVTGNVIRSDSGIFHVPLDRNGPATIRTRNSSGGKGRVDGVGVKNHDGLDVLSCDPVLPYCGVPLYFPVMTLFAEPWFYAPASPLANRVAPRASLAVISRTMRPDGTVRVRLVVSGPHHVNVHISPREGVELTWWSAGDGVPVATAMPAGPADSRPQYFIFYSYGTAPEQPWELSIDVRVDGAENEKENGGGGKGGKLEGDYKGGPLLDVALGAHYIAIANGELLTNEMESYFRSMPDWSIPIGWAVTYDSWVI